MANYYFINSINGDVAEITDDIHHIIKVSRNKTGSKIGLILKNRGRGHGKIISIEKDKIFVKINNWEKVTKNSTNISIVISPINPNSMKEIFKHGTELGVHRFYIASWGNSSFIKFNRPKFEKIIYESCKQSGNPHIPEIIETDYKEIAFEKGFYLCYKKDMNNNNILPDRGENLLFVGPEGGWTEKELEWFGERKMTNIKIGNNILRTETAAIAGLGLLIFNNKIKNE